MTKAKLIKLVTHWVNVLSLTEWEIDLLFDKDTEEEINGSAQIAMHTLYKTAKISFASDQWRNWDEKFANEIIVHELVHVILHPLDMCSRDVAEASLDEAGLKVFETIRNRVNEQTTEQLQHILTLD